jgi:thiol-disulfide isomerase/thioredoxin
MAVTGFAFCDGVSRTPARLSRVGRARLCRMETSNKREQNGQHGRDENCCVKRVQSAAQLSRLIADHDGCVLRVDRRGRFRSAARLVVLSVMHKNSLACGLLRPVVEEACEKHRYMAKFIELRTDSFPEAPDIARRLGVRRLPYFVLFKDGQRIDHINGMEARESLEQYVLDNL